MEQHKAWRSGYLILRKLAVVGTRYFPQFSMSLSVVYLRQSSTTNISCVAKVWWPQIEIEIEKRA